MTVLRQIPAFLLCLGIPAGLIAFGGAAFGSW